MEVASSYATDLSWTLAKKKPLVDAYLKVSNILNYAKVSTRVFRSNISTLGHFSKCPECSSCEIVAPASVLCTGKRTVCNLLWSIGKAFDTGYHKYHRLLSRASWSELRASRLLLELLIGAFGGSAGSALVFAIDETIERRWEKAYHFLRCPGCR